MESLDNPLFDAETSSNAYINTAIRFGMIGGGAAIVHTLIGLLTGIALRPSMMTGILSSLILLAIYIWPSREAVLTHHKEDLGGYISFGQAFLVAFITLMIIVLMHLSFNHIYYNFIDPDMVDQIVEITAEMMADFGLPDEHVERTMDETRESLTSIKGWGVGVAMWSVGSAIIALIIAAVLKKDRTDLF